LLRTIPLDHLLPRDGLLPPESLRTFCLDARWLQAFASGALSAGTSLSAEIPFAQAAFPAVFAQAALQAGLVDSPSGGVAPFAAVVSGFLLRSGVVKGWPKMEARAFGANGAPLARVRWDLLADGVMIALFIGQMASFDLLEPAESLHFGLEPEPPVEGQKLLRFIAGPKGGAGVPGETISSAPTVTPVCRGGNGQPGNRGDHGVLRVRDLAGKLGAGLAQAHANQNLDGTPRLFTSAEFALQMVEGVQVVAFDLTAP